MPELWSRAHIIVDSYEVTGPSPNWNISDKTKEFHANAKAEQDGRLAFLQMYLGRAGSLPLYLSVHDNVSFPGGDGSFLGTAMAFIPFPPYQGIALGREAQSCRVSTQIPGRGVLRARGT